MVNFCARTAYFTACYDHQKFRHSGATTWDSPSGADRDDGFWGGANFSPLPLFSGGEEEDDAAAASEGEGQPLARSHVLLARRRLVSANLEHRPRPLLRDLSRCGPSP